MQNQMGKFIPDQETMSIPLISDLSKMVSEITLCCNTERVFELVPRWLDHFLEIDYALVAQIDQEAHQVLLRGVSRENSSNPSLTKNLPIFGDLTELDQLEINRLYEWFENSPNLGILNEQFNLIQTRRALLQLLKTSDDGCWLILAALQNESGQFSEKDKELFKLVASQAAVSLENAIIYRGFQQNSRKMDEIYQASLALTGSLDLKVVLDTILKHALAIMDQAADCHIFLYDGRQLEFAAARWSNGKSGVAFANPRENGLTYTIARTGQLMAVNNTEIHPLYIDFNPKWSGSIIGLPLKIGDRVVGVISIAYEVPRVFKDSEVQTFRLLGDLAAVAIEKAHLHEIINLQAHTDMLTDLANRRSFDERLEYELMRSIRYNHEFVVIMLDLNGFKQVNDQYGHPAGDVVLKQIAGLLKENVRDTDLVARYGGDEFSIILPESGMSEAEQVLKKLERLFETNSLDVSTGKKVKLSAEAGYAVFPQDGTTVERLIASADERLYRSKRAYYERHKDAYRRNVD